MFNVLVKFNACVALSQAGKQHEAIGILEQLANNAVLEDRYECMYNYYIHTVYAVLLYYSHSHTVHVDIHIHFCHVGTYVDFRIYIIWYGCVGRFELPLAHWLYCLTTWNYMKRFRQNCYKE